MDIEEKLILLNDIFSPAAPIESADHFIGRTEQLQKIRQAIEERGQHIILYGNRGVGKTSLSNIISEVFVNLNCTKVTCTRTDNFYSIWKKAITRTNFVVEEKQIGFGNQSISRIIDMPWPQDADIDASHIETIFRELYNPILFIFDEFDSIRDKNTKIKMADTIKVLSDNIPNITIMIVGIAQNIAQLIGEHPSVERCIRQIYLAGMSEKESEDLLYRNMQILELRIDESVVQKIIECSSGFPHYIHLLGKFSARHAILDEAKRVSMSHLNKGVIESIENSSQSLSISYKKALDHTKDLPHFERILLACTTSILDEENTFSATDVFAKLRDEDKNQIKIDLIHSQLLLFCKEENGLLLEKLGKTNQMRFRFKSPLMRPFAKLKLHTKFKGN